MDTITVSGLNQKSKTELFKNPSRSRHQKMISLVIIFSLLILFLACLLRATVLSPDGLLHVISSNETQPTPSPSPYPSDDLHPMIKAACEQTLHPSLCLSTTAGHHHHHFSPSDNNATALHYFLEVAINHIMRLVVNTQADIALYLSALQEQEQLPLSLSLREKNAMSDCMDMMDQTLYELAQANDDLHAYPESIGFLHRFYGNLKTLLSAAMTNEDTCIDGFSDLESEATAGSSDFISNQKGIRAHIQIQMGPISRMISNCLAIIRYMETMNIQREMFDPPPAPDQSRRTTRTTTTTEQLPRKKGTAFPQWMTNRDRRMMGIRYRIRPHYVVAKDGSGDFRTIGEAVKMAPNTSIGRFVIKVKSGVYKEIVDIPRNKINIMLMGQGINSTVISGSRSFLDGYSTFTSATLTVVGDRFLARDLTVVNTAGPDKHQAVALRVTSNSAFFRCNFSSHQDTLYAHSLRQFYRDCTIEGTIDFIFGNAAAIFQNCLILVRKPKQGQKNMITAQGRDDPNQNTGISMQNCTIRPSPTFTYSDRKVFSTYLGRPWRNHSRTIIMKSYMGDLIHPQGWSEWNQYSTLDTVEYIEYKNFGPGSDTKRRVRWRGYKRNCTEDKAKQFTIGALLRGSDDWLETTGFPLFYGA